MNGKKKNNRQASDHWLLFLIQHFVGFSIEVILQSFDFFIELLDKPAKWDPTVNTLDEAATAKPQIKGVLQCQTIIRTITQSGFRTQIKTSPYIQVSGHEFSVFQIWKLWQIIQALLHKALINVRQMQFEYANCKQHNRNSITNDSYVECEKYRLHSRIFSVSSSSCLLCLFESLIFSNFWNPFLQQQQQEQHEKTM